MDAVIELALQQLATFTDRQAWHSSGPAQENLSREWDDLTITVFRRRGRWWWSIRGDGEPRFSKANYRNADEAIESVGLELLRP